MDLDLSGCILFPISSDAPADGEGKAQSKDCTMPALQSLESEDLAMLDVLHVFGRNGQDIYERRSHSVTKACQWWSAESDDPSSPTCSPKTVQILALQQRIRSNAPSPSPIPSILATAAASQVHSFQAEASDKMDIDTCFQPQNFFVGVADVSEVDLCLSSDCSSFPYLSSSNGANLYRSDHCSTFQGSMSQRAAETLSSDQRHTATNLSSQEPGSRDTVQQRQMARAQQEILSLQSEAQAFSQMAMRFHGLLGTRLQDDQAMLFDSLKLAASLAEKMALAVNKARAAESIIWSLVSLTTSMHEAQALQQQAEDAQQLSQEMLGHQRHIHKQGQHLGAMVPPSSSTPQHSLPAQPAAAVRPQVQMQDQTRVQPMAKVQPLPIDQGQETFIQVHRATEHRPQAIGQASRTKGPQQQSQAKHVARRNSPWHHFHNTEEQAHSQQRFLQTLYGLRPVVYSGQPRPQAISSPTQRAVVSGQLFTAQKGVSDYYCPYLRPHPSKGEPEAHREAIPFLRGGSSGDGEISRSAAREIDEDGSDDIQRSPNVAGSVHASRPEGQSSNSVNSSTVFAAVHQRTFANAPSLQTTTPSIRCRRDSIIERLRESELDVIVLRNGMDTQKMTQEEKRELAQNDLDNWREQQRGRLHATLHPTAQPSSSSVDARQTDTRGSDPGGIKTDPAAGRLERSLEQTRLVAAGTEAESGDAGAVKRAIHAQEQHMLAQARRRDVDAQMQRLLHHPDSRHITQLSGPVPTFAVPAVGHGPGHQIYRQPPQHDSQHMMALRPHSRANASRTNFAEIVDEVTREVLAPGPGRCGITGV